MPNLKKLKDTALPTITINFKNKKELKNYISKFKKKESIIADIIKGD
tara:strand:- start:53 stop:193 length:141 start_codon:yes stop_codon:yes gene_type:complete